MFKLHGIYAPIQKILIEILTKTEWHNYPNYDGY